MSTDAFLVHGRWIFGATEHPGQTRFDGAIRVAAGRIEEVGDAADLKRRFPDLPVLGGPGFAVAPGLVNAHHHAFGGSLIAQGLEDDRLEPWLVKLPLAPARDTLAAMLRSGVTSVVDMCEVLGEEATLRDLVAAKAEAYRTVGIRAVVAPGVPERSELLHVDEAQRDFVAALPDELAALARQRLDAPRLNGEAYVRTIASLARDFADDPRFDVWFGPPGPQWVTPETWRSIVHRLAPQGPRLQTHLLESIDEKIAGQRRPPGTLAQLEADGVLGPLASFAHGVWLSPADLETLARHRAAIVHNPSSNLRLRSGIAPIAEARRAGVPTALGMDGTSFADDENFFAEIRLAWRLSRAPLPDWPPVEPGDVFEMATRGGAALLGRDHDLGRLAPGFRADLVLLDLDRLLPPRVTPAADPLRLVLSLAQPSHVHTVLVDGQVLVREGRLCRLNEPALHAALAADLEPASPDVDLYSQHVELARRVNAWHAARRPHRLEPLTVFNTTE